MIITTFFSHCHQKPISFDSVIKAIELGRRCTAFQCITQWWEEKEKWEIKLITFKITSKRLRWEASFDLFLPIQGT
jgi:hypothetical protein